MECLLEFQLLPFNTISVWLHLERQKIMDSVPGPFYHVEDQDRIPESRFSWINYSHSSHLKSDLTDNFKKAERPGNNQNSLYFQSFSRELLELYISISYNKKQNWNCKFYIFLILVACRIHVWTQGPITFHLIFKISIHMRRTAFVYGISAVLRT